jgi:predicted Zn-dependent peptidase
MIAFEEFKLDNGLKVIVHEDPSVGIAALNVLYGVGSKNEEEDKTGFAHLFEHLMFGGSANIPDYDKELQLVGGQNNAFTTPDFTNYYLTLPANNIETGFWLESDRMLQLAFNEKSLEVQRSVVIEEFKQRYLNQPYGDLWLQLRPLAYTKHPYRWPTIGKEIAHIERATMDDVRGFFNRFYSPDNAILVISGNIKTAKAKKLATKWFGPIERNSDVKPHIPEEPVQKEARRLEIERKVPLDLFTRVYHMPERKNRDYYATDLLSDILGRGKSSRLFRKLVKEDQVFNDLSAYVTGSVDPGLLVVSGKVNKNKNLKSAEDAVDKMLEELITKGVKESELQKVKNQAESTIEFNEVEVLNRAMSLAFGCFLGNTNLVNEEIDIIESVTVARCNEIASQVLDQNNSTTLIMKSNLN